MKSLRNSIAFAAIAAAVAALAPLRAQAIPIFAERYHLSCETCHSVLPELNAFGRAFREHGYRLPLPKHATTPVALRYQMEYEETPPAGNRRYTPGGVLLSNADVGRVSAFIHYNLGAGGGPAGLYLGYLTTYNEHTGTLYRAGLIELPLAQSPGQRLDDLQPYGYYGTHVGLNDLSLASPRWGAQVERLIGETTVDVIADLGEFKGAAYGGKPIPTGEITSAATPELGLFARAPMIGSLEIGGQALTGTRHVVQTAGNAFNDTYTRSGVFVHDTFWRFDAQGEQWWGTDSNIDGFATSQPSAGGYVRLKYYLTDHAYLGVRYDAADNPVVTRDFVYYGAFQILPDVRLLVQQVVPLGGKPQLGAALTVGFPPITNI